MLVSGRVKETNLRDMHHFPPNDLLGWKEDFFKRKEANLRDTSPPHFTMKNVELNLWSFGRFFFQTPAHSSLIMIQRLHKTGIFAYNDPIHLSHSCR